MQYIITFLEGIISFISPCVLPMLPVYIIYFTGDSGNAGGDRSSGGKWRAVTNSIGFVLGFMSIFMILGAFAGSLSGVFVAHKRALELICGAVVILFGLSFLSLVKISVFPRAKKGGKITGFVSAYVFGVVYSASLTPCVGAFLGSALMMAGTSGTALKGMMLLACYSLGMGIPFVLSALLIDQLKGAFDIIKKNYKVINVLCGLFLIVTGVLMMMGHFGRWMDMLT